MNINQVWGTFSAAPHRMFFFCGVMQALLIILWWLADLAGRFGGFYLPFEWSVMPPDAHAFLMIYGFFALFIFGFLMTTYPRWMNGEEVERDLYVPAALLLAAGIVVLYIGLIWIKFLLILSALLFLAGWGIALVALLGVYLRAQHPDKRHAHITSTALIVGWLLAAAWFVGEMHDVAFLVALAKSGGVWVFLLPVFFAVSHRMIPFFSANVIVDYRIVRPMWPLALVPAGALLHCILELSGGSAWLWLVDLPMAAAAIYLSWMWRLKASFAQPLLAMLHIGFAWLGVALLLDASQSLALLAGYSILGKAPLHALVMGYFASMALGMITRVTLGHSGRTLAADRVTWGLFLAFQGVVAVRIAADFPGLSFLARGNLYIATAVLWLACFALWAWRFVPIYWRPRPDGKPG